MKLTMLFAVLCVAASSFFVGAAQAQDMSAEDRLVSSSPYRGIGTRNDHSTYDLALSFRKEGDKLWGIIGSSEVKNIKASKEGVSFEVTVGNRLMKVSLDFEPDGILKGKITGPRSSGSGTFEDHLRLRPKL